MRIPQYESQVGVPTPPQFNRIQDVRTDNLSGLIEGLDMVVQAQKKEQEEAKKTAIFQADNSIKMAMDKAAFDIMTRIKNGGSYANAEKEYNAAFQDAYAKFGGAFDVDESGNTRKRIESEYQVANLNQMMRIQEAVTSRRKSDTVDSANNRIDLLKREYAFARTPEEKEAAMSKITSVMAGLSGSGAITPDEGKQKLRDVIGGAEADRIQILAQNNKDNPQAVLDEIERSKDVLDVDTYISMRGAALKQVEEVGNYTKVIQYKDDPVSNERPDQQSVDMYMQKYIQDNQETISQNPALFEKESIETAITTGRVPTIVANQAAVYLSSGADALPAQDAATAAQAARIVAGISKYNSVLADGAKFDEKTIARANMIVSRTEAGMSEEQAVNSVRSTMNDATRQAAYLAGKKNFTSKLAKGELELEYRTPEIQSLASDKYAQYVAEGASFDEAASLVKKDIKETVRTFNGVPVTRSAQEMFLSKDGTPIYSEEGLITAAETKVKQTIGGVPEGQKVVLQVDREAMRLQAAGKQPTFPIALYDDESKIYIADFLRDPKTGQPVRVEVTADAIRNDKAAQIMRGETMMNSENFKRFVKARGFTDEFVQRNSGFVITKFVNSDYHK